MNNCNCCPRAGNNCQVKAGLSGDLYTASRYEGKSQQIDYVGHMWLYCCVYGRMQLRAVLCLCKEA